MRYSRLFILFALVICGIKLSATTWNEPWQDQVIKEASSFVLAKVKSFDEKKGVKIEIIKTLAGDELSGTIKISEFYLLEICSMSGGHGPEFHFGDIDECYFMIKKVGRKYAIATPTSGFDYIAKGKVYATYRHSYHQALVPIDDYEKTMTAIFNHYHQKEFDKVFIKSYCDKYLSMKPAGFSKDEISTFFQQHVALECIYHLKLDTYAEKLIPFLRDTSNFHNQVSAARALGANNTSEVKSELLNVISDSNRREFVQVMCVQSLSGMKPTELKPQLEKLANTASDEGDGFGGNIMDPRVCTHIPSLRSAIKELVKTL